MDPSDKSGRPCNRPGPTHNCPMFGQMLPCAFTKRYEDFVKDGMHVYFNRNIAILRLPFVMLR
jgi:hypothetical protein